MSWVLVLAEAVVRGNSCVWIFFLPSTRVSGLALLTDLLFKPRSVSPQLCDFWDEWSDLSEPPL